MVDICAGIGTHALVASDLCLCPVGLFDKDQEALQAAAVIRREFLPSRVMDFHDRRHWWTVAQCGAAWWGMSPPCQDYCGSGTHKSLNGERGWTSLEILLGIVLCGPKGFCI